jgi:hypothetical protein
MAGEFQRTKGGLIFWSVVLFTSFIDVCKDWLSSLLRRKFEHVLLDAYRNGFPCFFATFDFSCEMNVSFDAISITLSCR